MKIAVIHTDLRAYWPARLRRFHEFCANHGDELVVAELSSTGSTYAFDEALVAATWWKRLLPQTDLWTLDAKTAKSAFHAFLNAECPDVVVSGGIAFFSGASAIQWGQRHQKPVVVMDNARRQDVPRSWFVNRIKKTLYRSVSAAFIPAPSHDADYRFWGFTTDQIHYGLNTTDTDYWREPSAPCKLVDNFKEQGITKFIVGVGRLVEKKNWRFLLESHARVSKQLSDPTHLVLVGDGPEKSSLVEFVRSSNLKTVHFVPFQPPSTLRCIYQNASALVLPSLYGETWGLVTNEAMASGTPVLVSRQAGCAKALVQHGVNGWQFDPEVGEDLDQCLLSLHAASEDQIRRMGNAARMAAEDWGLDRFSCGLHKACRTALHAYEGNTRRRPLIERILIESWNGRYRPT